MKKALFLLFASYAVHSSFSAESVTYDRPEADTYIQAGAEGSSAFGQKPTTLVRTSENRAYNRITYLRFPAGSELPWPIASARLSLTVASLFKGRTEPSAIDIYGAKDLAWEEATLSNNSAPWPAPETKRAIGELKNLGSVQVPAGEDSSAGASISLASEQLASFLEGARSSKAKSVTFILIERLPSPNAVAFATKENESLPAPSLTVMSSGK